MSGARLRVIAPAIAAALAATIVLGCGDGGEASSGATVSVYADAGLCAGAKRALSASDGEAGDLSVRVVCASPVREAGRLDLAAVGANARRATQDSSSVAYIEPDDPAATRFAHPILESANLGWATAASGAAAMHRVLRAITNANPSSLRHDVRETLEAE